MKSQQNKRQPGTELESLFAMLRIQKTLDCDCQDVIDMMDGKGIEWCRANKPYIVGRIKSNAQKMGFPFNATAAMWLLRISLA